MVVRIHSCTLPILLYSYMVACLLLADEVRLELVIGRDRCAVQVPVSVIQ